MPRQCGTAWSRSALGHNTISRLSNMLDYMKDFNLIYILNILNVSLYDSSYKIGHIKSKITGSVSRWLLVRVGLLSTDSIGTFNYITFFESSRAKTIMNLDFTNR